MKVTELKSKPLDIIEFDKDDGNYGIISSYANLNILSSNLIPKIELIGGVGKNCHELDKQAMVIKHLDPIDDKNSTLINHFIRNFPEYLEKRMETGESREQAICNIILESDIAEKVSGNARSLLDVEFLKDYSLIFSPEKDYIKRQVGGKNRIQDCLDPQNVSIEIFGITSDGDCDHAVRIRNPSFIGDPMTLTTMIKNIGEQVEQIKLEEQVYQKVHSSEQSPS